jgi:hypothetical protein
MERPNSGHLQLRTHEVRFFRCPEYPPTPIPNVTVWMGSLTISFAAAIRAEYWPRGNTPCEPISIFSTDDRDPSPGIKASNFPLFAKVDAF